MYSYVIFFNCSIGGVCIGLGIFFYCLGDIVGVVKVYFIRVGSGGFFIEFYNVSEYVTECFFYNVWYDNIWYNSWGIFCLVCFLIEKDFVFLNFFVILNWYKIGIFCFRDV